MKDQTSRFRLQLLLIRVVMGLVFGFLLTRFFLPAGGLWTILLVAGLLVFFAYAFEALHKSRRP